MKLLAVILLLLFSFVSVTCESYRGAFSEDLKSCHPAESDGSPDETSFDCCNGLPAKGDQKIESFTAAPYVAPIVQAVLIKISAAIIHADQWHLSQPIVDRLPVLRL